MASTSADSTLFGRDDLLTELAEITCGRRSPLTLLHGEAGAGRTAVLRELGARLTKADVQVLELRLGENDHLTPYGVLYRVLSDIDALTPFEPRGYISPLALAAKLSSAPVPIAPKIADRLAAAACSAARRLPPLVMLFDDAQWLDEATTSLLQPLVYRMVGSSFSMVLSLRSDAVGRLVTSAPDIERLREAGVVRSVPVRPLTWSQSKQLITRTLRAKPATEVVDALHGAARGRPAALVAGIAAHRDAGALSLTDRHAYLVPPNGRPALHEWDTLLAPVREAGESAWTVARAMSVLAPLGADAPRLVEQVLDLDLDAVRAALDLLRQRRVLIRSGDGWRFRLPMTAAALESGLGPFERRHYSAAAVVELWAGTANTDDPLYLPNRLVDTGNLVDPQQVGQELLELGTRSKYQDSPNAARWLQAAAERLADPALRATSLLAQAGACTVHKQLVEAAAHGRLLLERHAGEFDPDLLQNLVLAYLTILAGTGDRAELLHVVEAETPFPGGRAQTLVAKAFALGWLNRWVEGRRLLECNRNDWVDAHPDLVEQANIYRTGVAVMQGDNAELFRSIQQRGPSPRLLEAERHRHQADMLLAMGELDSAIELLDRNSLQVEQLPHSVRFLVEYARGDWVSAMDHARRSMSAPVLAARPVAWAMLHACAAQAHIEGGMLNRAREVIESGRPGPFDYLFDYVESKVLRVLGEQEAADARLRAGLDAADAAEFALGTELMWSDLAQRLHRSGDHARAQEALNRLEKLTAQLGTGRAELALLVTRARLHGDAADADAAAELARERGQPYEMATVFSEVAKTGHRAGKLLPEAYELAGGLNGLLLRSRLRRVMRENDVPVPNRANTIQENEQLLAVLVTEGLTNRQMATVFGATEKSVEGRLTRMFARIGYRSRVELAAAMLTGEYTG